MNKILKDLRPPNTENLKPSIFNEAVSMGLDAFQLLLDELPLFLDLEMILEVDPEFGRVAEEPGEPQGRGHGDAPLALDDLADPRLVDPCLLRQAVGRDAHGLQELQQEDLAGMDIGHFTHGFRLLKNDNP